MRIVTPTKDVHVVVGIIMRNNKVLVAQRPQGKPYSGYWEFPGGKIEKNEASEIALKRELQEELGIEVAVAQSWFDHRHSYPDKTVLLHVWLVTEFHGEPLNKENQILRWVTLAELSELKVLEGNLIFHKKLKYLNC